MSNFNYTRKLEHEKAAEKAILAGDYQTAFIHTAKAAQFAFNLAEQCQGSLREAYIVNGNVLTSIAEELKQKDLASASRSVSGNSQTGDENPPFDAGSTRLERPGVRLADVAGMEKVKEEIMVRVINPLRDPEKAREYDISAGGGIMLYGPPGTGKTFIARAVAGELNLPFYVITAADIFGKYVGESETNVRRLFAEARRNPFSVIFIDELETVFPKRTENIHESTRKVISILLQELDGIDNTRNPILLIGATNTPWQIDEAFLRTGRFDLSVYVGLPDGSAREKIIVNAFKKVQKPVDRAGIDYLVSHSGGYSGADLKGITTRIKQSAYRKQAGALGKELFEECLKEYTPSCSPDISEKIAAWEKSVGIVRTE
ncbi:MAG: ATP-binding protein [Lentisphaeria bacterium]|nr:ATP-binding protein [Lentisphaeria bacterium]